MGGKPIERCRGCGSKSLTPAFTFGGDAAYVFCDGEKDATACGLLQRAATPLLQDTIDTAPPVTRTHRHRLRGAVTEAMEMISTRDGLALDIGCGDGTLMSFYPRWIEAYAVDQLMPDERIRDWGKAVHGSFPEGDVVKTLRSHIGKRKFDVITAISVFQEIEDPSAFFGGIKDLLADDGVCVLETPYASLGLVRNAVGMFHNSALTIHTLTTIERLARLNGLKIVRGAMTETDGGALRLFLTHNCYVGHDYVPWLESLARLWDEEIALALTSRSTYQAFSHRIDANRQTVDSFLEEMRDYGEHAHVIGSDPAMIALLEAFEIGPDVVSFIVSRHEDKISSRVHIGRAEAGIEVISEEDSRQASPDVYLAPNSLRREILEHWRESIFAGVRIVFMTPDLEIVDADNYGTELGKCLALTDGPGSLETLKAVLSTVRRPRLVAVSNG
ncbi:MAG: class I SAM-dependent methyltransferase [Parvularculaceae bacterium]